MSVVGLDGMIPGHAEYYKRMQTRLAQKQSDRCQACGRKFRRSNPANARLWLIYHALSEKLPVQGKTYSADQWHAYMKTRFLGADDLLLPNGKTLVMPRSTANLDVAEFQTYMENVEAWAAEHDVYLDEIFEP